MIHARRAINSIFSLAIAALAAAFAPGVEASPTLTYTITDLTEPTTGLYADPRTLYGSDAGGGLVFASDGSAYRFNPSSSNQTSTDGLPLMLGKPSPLPVLFGSPDYSSTYDRVTAAVQNSHGFTAYAESSGINGHPWDGTSALVAVQVGADGAPGQPVKLAWIGGATKAGVGLGGSYNYLTLNSVNNLNQVLYKGALNPYPEAGLIMDSPVYLYDSLSGTKVDLVPC